MALTVGMPPEKRSTPCQEEDRISQLPDEILILILSCMPMSYAAATTVLSKRWRHLFYFLPSLQFYGFHDRSLGSRDDDHAREFTTILDVLRSRRTPLKRCVISIELDDEDMHRIMQVLCEGGVEELSMSCRRDEPYEISSHVFSCGTILSLDLYHCNLAVPSELTGLQSLRTLELMDVVVTDEQFETMVSGCVSLESLTVFNAFQVKNMVICSKRLSRLVVATHRPLGIFVEEAPCLDLAIVSHFHREADIYTKDVANTEFYSPKGEIAESDSEEEGSEDEEEEEEEEESEVSRLLWLLVGLSHVKTLKLEFDTEAAECLAFQEVIPISLAPERHMIQLKKLFLKMHFNDVYLASMLSCILNSSPNLQELTVGIDELHLYSEIVEEDYWDRQVPSECVRNQLKTITLYLQDNFVEDCIGFPRFLLMNASALEKMSINYTPDEEEKSSFPRFQQELLCVQTASPDAILEWTFSDCFFYNF